MTLPPAPHDHRPSAEGHAPFFATADGFVDTVYTDWSYFMRVPIAQFPALFERERETGTRAPLGAGWYVPLVVPKARRRFETRLATCDVQELLVDAIDLCTKDPRRKSFYSRFTPLY